MGEFEFTPATKEQAKARVAFAGLPGSGKTWTSMIWATVFSGGERFAVIDTERGSAAKYADVFNFDVLTLTEYDPRDLIKAIAAAEKRGYPCLNIDTLSRFWSGKSGMLEFVDNVTKRTSHGNTFSSGWKEARPVENDMLEAMLGYSEHLIATMRVKPHYDVSRGQDGKTVPVKIGLQPDQRGGIEYEFDVVCDMDQEINLTISKTRCPALTGQVYNRPGPEIAETILAWLNDGTAGTSARDFADRALDPAATFAGLGALKQEIREAGKSGAMVIDTRPDHGDVISLDALVNRRGVEVRAAGQPPATPARDTAAVTRSKPAERANLGDWGEAIDAIAGPEDAEVLEADADKSMADGSLDQVKGAAVKKAIKAKVASLQKRADAA